MEYKYLNSINGPEDVKKIPEDKLPELASEIREALFNRLTKKGGHFGPNFGMVEMTIALHYVFESPKDRFVFDVAHQTYPHKMLTGRAKAYIDDAHFGDVGGFTNPAESEHDMFYIGHTSTSVSLATGLAHGRDVTGGKGNVVAIIGDGSLSGGEALEGLDYAGEMKTNLIIVVNDNEQSIAENHGGLYKNLAELRKSGGACENNLFRSMGLDYRYVEEGNDVSSLIKAFKEVKDIDHPIVVHVHTQKGKGYPRAEENRESWHWSPPFNRETGEPLFKWDGESYNSIFAEHILEKLKSDSSIVVVTAAVPGAVGLSQDVRSKMGNNYVDVGIAEEQATAMCSGIAKAGGKPIFATNATFAQRVYDQMTQDVSLNKSAVTLHLSSSSVFGMGDATHIGISAIGMFSNIPGLVYMSPTSKEEYLAMLDYSIDQNDHPVVLAVPCDGVNHAAYPVCTDFDGVKYQICEKGEDVAILALGDFFNLGRAVAEYIGEKSGKKVTLINPRFATGLDEKTLDSLLSNHKTIVTLEDGILDGGFGQKVASYYGDKDVKVFNYGFERKFYDGVIVNEVMEERRLTPELIYEDIKSK
ncbi:MAG: 1-deoxy-D-xylulose-5-phosphate synthase [Lachnospiraceae bacterium]|nr:1-deoxy-D-xylulose-5-phosphate synthase [Lachnospiraceae bacterium]